MAIAWILSLVREAPVFGEVLLEVFFTILVELQIIQNVSRRYKRRKIISLNRFDLQANLIEIRNWLFFTMSFITLHFASLDNAEI